jgi:DNA (cytosine-5)-methyltransferase 1
VSGDIEQSEQEGKATSADIRTSSNESNSYTLKIRGGCERDSSGKKAGKGALIQTELSGTLGVSQDQTLITKCLNSWDVQSKHIQPENGKAESLYSGECRYGGGESYVMQSVCIGNGQIHDAESPSVEVSKTLNCMDDPMKIITIEGNGSRESHRGNGYKETETMYSLNTVEQHGVCYGLDMCAGRGVAYYDENVSPTHCADGHTNAIAYGLDRASFNQGQNAQYDFSVQEEIAQTLDARMGEGGG